MPSESPDFDRDYEAESTFLNDIKAGRLVSATVFVPDDTIEDLTVEAEGFPVLSGPGYAAVIIELAIIESVVKDDDGDALYLIRPVALELLCLDSEVVGRKFLVTSGQLFPADSDMLYLHLLKRLGEMLDTSLTRQELLDSIRTLLIETDNDPDEI